LITYVANKLKTGIPFISDDDALNTIRAGIDSGELDGKLDMSDPRLSTSNVEECYAIYCQKIDSFDRNNPNYMKSAGVRIDDFDSLSEQYPDGWIVQTNMVFNFDAKQYTLNEDTNKENGIALVLPGQVETTTVKWRADRLRVTNLKDENRLGLWGASNYGNPIVITVENQNLYFKQPLITKLNSDDPTDVFPEMNEDQKGNMNCVLASVTLLDYVDEISKTAESNSFDGNIPELVSESWNNKMRMMELESQERYIRTNAGATIVSTKTSAFGGERSNEQAYLDRTIGNPNLSQSAWSNPLSDAKHVISDEFQYWKAEAEAGASQDWPINQANSVKIAGKTIPIPAGAIADGFATYFKIEGIEEAVSSEIETLKRELNGTPPPTPEHKAELEAKIAELERLVGKDSIYQYVKGGDQYPGYIVNPALWNRSLEHWENELLSKLGKKKQKLVNILKFLRNISDDIFDICCLVSDLTMISTHLNKMLPALKLGLTIAVNIGIPVSIKVQKSNDGAASTKAADSFGRAFNNAIQSMMYMVKYSAVVFLLNTAMVIIRKVFDELTSSNRFARCFKTVELEEFIVSSLSDIGRRASQTARDAMTSYYDSDSEESLSIVVRRIKMHNMLKLIDAFARAVSAGELCAQKSRYDTNKYEEIKAVIDAATENTLGEMEQAIMSGADPSEIHRNLVNQLALEYARQNDILSPEASAAKLVATLDAMYPTDKELERFLTYRLGVNPARTSEILNNRTGVTPTGLSFGTDDSILSIANLISPCAKNISQDDLTTIIRSLQEAGVV